MSAVSKFLCSVSYFLCFTLFLKETLTKCDDFIFWWLAYSWHCVFTWGWPSGITYWSCYSLLLLFITSIKILAWLGEINCYGLLKIANININSFYKISKHICPCLSLCVQFSVYFCQCEYMYVCVCGSSCASECNVLICMWRIDKKYFNVEHNELKMLANTQLK